MFAQFQHNVHIAVIIEKAQKSHHIRMIQRFMNLNFLRHFVSLIMLHHQFFWHNFTSIRFICLHILNCIAFCKTTLFEKWRKRKTEREREKKVNFYVKLWNEIKETIHQFHVNSSFSYQLIISIEMFIEQFPVTICKRQFCNSIQVFQWYQFAIDFVFRVQL